ncbi:hypothetical protein [Streptomyces anulatus]|uniref:hypothetical protein n=1 Tax=Streptomyces anulatus TaxID=1892 RepID=UPI0034027A10
MKPTEEVLQDLTQPSNVSVHSDVVLVGKVEAAIAADDKKRKENEDEPLRRKPALAPTPQTELPRQFEVTLWDVLHTLARATALSWRGAGRGLAEHWGALKHTQALAGGRNSFLRLTDEGHRIADHYKSLQSGELGIGFALTLAEHTLRNRFPNHTVTIVPASSLALLSVDLEAVARRLKLTLESSWDGRGGVRAAFFVLDGTDFVVTHHEGDAPGTHVWTRKGGPVDPAARAGSLLAALGVGPEAVSYSVWGVGTDLRHVPAAWGHGRGKPTRSHQDLGPTSRGARICSSAV